MERLRNEQPSGTRAFVRTSNDIVTLYQTIAPTEWKITHILLEQMIGVRGDSGIAKMSESAASRC
jgi:hypothetical protein